MSNTALKLLVISALLFSCVIAAFNPSFRVTDPMNVRQHQDVQQEIYRYMSIISDSLRRYVDSNYVQYGKYIYDADDTTGLGCEYIEKFIYLDDKYESADDYTVQITIETTVSGDQFIYALVKTDSSFFIGIERAACNATNFYWLTAGVRKTE